MHPSPSLAELQRWMRWALTHPLGVGRAISGERLALLPDRFTEPRPRALTAVAGDDARGRTAVDRLAVYGSGYFSRLHWTLQLEYPRLSAALGEKTFRELVAAHLLRQPSTSPSLADLGEELGDTLRIHPSGAELPWLVDLAAVERAAAEVWLSDAPAADGPLLAATERWEEVRLALAPTARLVRLAWDVSEWTVGSEPPPRRPGWLLVWRAEASTGLEWIDAAPGTLLEALARGVPLDEASAVAESLGMTPEDVTGTFGHWGARGWLVRSRNPEDFRGAA